MEIVTLPAAGEPAADVAAVRDGLVREAARYGLTTGELIVEIGTLGLPGKDEDAPAQASAAHADRLRVPVLLYRTTALIGPVQHPVAPGHAPVRPCVSCLRRRWLRLRKEHEREALEADGGVWVVAGGTPLLAEFGTPHIAAVLARLYARDDTRDPRRADVADVIEVDLSTGRTTRHPLLAEPDCPQCGPGWPDTPPQAIGFPAARPGLAPGSSRLRSWRDYALPKKALVNPVCGVLGALSTGSSRGAAVNANLNGTMRLGGTRTEGVPLYEVSWSGHSQSYAESEAMAFLEGLERYAGQHARGRRAAATASLNELRRLSLPALDPRAGLGHGPEFYAARGPHMVPFTPDLSLDWLWGHSLRDERAVLVPEQLAFYGPRPPGVRFTTSSSSGCATGSCLEEAALFGLLELIERDAFLLTWYGAQRVQAIDPRDCGRSGTAALIDRMSGEGYDIHLFDMRIDLPVPAVLCVAKRRVPGPGDVVFSAGAALEPADAVASAVGEVSSLVENFSARVTTAESELRAMADDYDKVRTLHDHLMLYGLPEMADRTDFLFGARETGPRPLDEVFADWNRVRPRDGDVRSQLAHCARLVTDAVDGELAVVDQTPPEQLGIGVRTVAVVSQGLIPIDFGWDQQRALHSERLRTAAHRAGLRSAPLSDEEIHRHPHPFP
ncbi:TOMM precursor leader peptide-binding protein [Streptomyces sp. NBC_01381]|uniref:TOMM precursor leader peptide-binding protein n=1 Tax=Streptomyces sp. NBC_01381 TaxID=2903845 RepID=UPI0022588BB0|nr:TOMM precursor leader peptide-binding protein [Streptomyces sp. NBC_01381]MCX4670904.1 TOMM precursor leader peptide-binding protein [Streptomyces sp. NBC_01381]